LLSGIWMNEGGLEGRGGNMLPVTRRRIRALETDCGRHQLNS
jgi:hypothetical protein